MKANELRVGNYVGIIKPDIETECDPYHILEVHQGATMYKPIPLTEEWLLNFGFEHKQKYAIGAGSYSMWELSGFILLRRIGVEYYFPSLPFSTVLPYVHQLQNLYFALTGHELVTSSL